MHRLRIGKLKQGIIEELKLAGAKLTLFASDITGRSYTTLLNRTLPNGIKNSDTIQRVSGDVVLQDSDIAVLDTSPVNVDYVLILKKTDFIGYNSVNTLYNNAFKLGSYANFTSYPYDDVSKIGMVASSGSSIRWLLVVAKGTYANLAAAQAALTGTVLRYQLATPIDILNTPPPTPWVDLTGNANNALMQGLANTSDSGIAYVPLVCETGTPVEYANLVTNGDFANGITGWNNVNATIANESGRLAITASAQYGRSDQTINGLVIGNKYNVTVTIEGTTNNYAFVIGIGSTTTNLTINGVQRISFIFTATATTHTIGIGDIRTTGFTKFWADNAMVVNLGTPQITALESQMPNPLTALECDRLFPFVATSGVSKIGLRPMMFLDGINDVGVLANNPSVDIVGTGDFAIAVGFLTPSVMNNNQIICKNLDSAANIQYSINSLLDGQIIVYLNGTPIQVVGFGQVLPNNMYDLRTYRINGRLIAKLQNVEKSNQANTTALVSQPHLRLGGRSNSADGSVNTAFFKGGIAWAIIATGAEVANIDKALDRKARDYRMMG